ncbi:hypothetical protein PGJ85_016250 [Acinetobacter baumannii]|nr:MULTISPECIES: hypothetical protein [Acinetobacter]MDA4916991.1 hypothetical protein [Acinetobacter baumannii]
MTKGQILQRLFIRFLIAKKFEKYEFTQIWSLFIENRKYLNTEENFEFIYQFFKQLLEKRFFIIDMEKLPLKYTSAYESYELKKFNLPEELQSAYESIFIKTKSLEKDLQKNEMEIQYFEEYFKEYPVIQFQIELLLHKKQQEHLKLKTQVDVLKELIKTFD